MRLNKLLKFSRIGCVPCKVLENYLNDNNITYADIDVEEDVETTTKYGVGGLPTLILVDEDGSVLDRSVGFSPPDADRMASNL